MTEPAEPSPDDRLLQAFRKLVRAEFPWLSYLGVFEYAVQSSDGTAVTPASVIDATPTDDSIGLPTITKCRIVLPMKVTPKDGAIAYIIFANGDPSRPRCVGFEDSLALLEFMGGSPPAGAARIGDTAGPYAIITGSTKCFIG